MQRVIQIRQARIQPPLSHPRTMKPPRQEDTMRTVLLNRCTHQIHPLTHLLHIAEALMSVGALEVREGAPVSLGRENSLPLFHGRLLVVACRGRPA